MIKLSIINHYAGVLLAVLSVACHADHLVAHRSDSVFGLPDWLNISINHRIRYETLDGQYRAKTNGLPGNGGDQALVFRTLARVRMDLNQFTIGAEMQDSRISLADSGTATNSKRLTTTIANPLELLQAYLEVPVNDIGLKNSQSLLRLGRITMDVGSRRLVARNRFRNTINAFTGIDWQWNYQDQGFRAFYTFPVERRVQGDIRNNHPRFDSERTTTRFWGLDYHQNLFTQTDQGEVFLFGLDREKQKKTVKNLSLYTFGFRVWRKPANQLFDYQLESVYQLGHSRLSSAPSKTLDHVAFFHHAEFGYQSNSVWSPRLILQYDYASGDDSPNDGENNRFNTLFGARRFDFGPTSIYGAFARSNLHSPGLRLKMRPLKSLKTMFVVRGYWLASTADLWTTAGIKGNQAYIGTQIEASLRWQVLSKHLQLEAGVAHLFAGDLMSKAGKGNATYAYSQMTVKF